LLISFHSDTSFLTLPWFKQLNRTLQRLCYDRRKLNLYVTSSVTSKCLHSFIVLLKRGDIWGIKYALDLDIMSDIRWIFFRGVLNNGCACWVIASNTLNTKEILKIYLIEQKIYPNHQDEWYVYQSDLSCHVSDCTVWLEEKSLTHCSKLPWKKFTFPFNSLYSLYIHVG
jgi:hypothetical protein